MIKRDNSSEAVGSMSCLKNSKNASKLENKERWREECVMRDR